MSSAIFVRALSRSSPAQFRPIPHAASTASRFAPACASAAIHTTTKRLSSPHGEETFEQFSARYEKEFNSVNDVFELQRNLNNSFAYDLVPSVSVCQAALRAARRVNDFPTAVRIFEGIKVKVENKGQYKEYLKELQPIREELGVVLAEDLYPDPQQRVRRFE